MSDIAAAAQHHTKAHHNSTKTTFGFWVYLMTDCILFATLFATFAVLRNRTAGGPDGAELFSLPFVFAETMLLLFSSFACGLALLAARRGNKYRTLTMLSFTGVLGAGFLAMELYEFGHLVSEGHSWQASAFLSAFFTLVGTHGLHILLGLIWIIVMLTQILGRGLTVHTVRRLGLFSLFWHFLDIIWIFIFSIVYLLGVA
jgi:cytochrome o ubiquinol oxidase subunit III